jgi:hypothetical protein
LAISYKAKTLSGTLAQWILGNSNHFDAEGRFLPEHPGTTITGLPVDERREDGTFPEGTLNYLVGK